PQIASERFAGESRRQNILSNIEFILREMGSDAPDFSPVFIQALRQDPAVCVRLGAAMALGRIARTPETVVPALVAASSDRDYTVGLVALDALASFGTNAQQAVSALEKFLNDKDPRFRAK